jgi:cell division protein ZapA
MASVEIEIASRKYAIACRDGEEAKLRTIAAIVDGKARDAAAALGGMGEARHLLFASLLLADELKERREGTPAPPQPAQPANDPSVAIALERLAERVERLADSLERNGASS